MPLTNQNFMLRPISITVALLATLVCTVVTTCVTVSFAEARPPAGKARQKSAPFGEFKLSNYALLDAHLGKNSAIDGDIHAPTGQKVQATSPQYAMEATRIQMKVRRTTGENPRLRAQSAIATGSVRLVVRNPQEHRVSIVTCDKAVYTADPNSSSSYGGHIDLTGNVVWTVKDTLTNETLAESTNDHGTIDLIGPNETNIHLEGGASGGTIRGVIKEPAPKAKPGP